MKRSEIDTDGDMPTPLELEVMQDITNTLLSKAVEEFISRRPEVREDRIMIAEMRFEWVSESRRPIRKAHYRPASIHVSEPHGSVLSRFDTPDGIVYGVKALLPDLDEIAFEFLVTLVTGIPLPIGEPIWQ